ncbi:MAG: HlyD family secretion protein [Pseudomonadota bacterium]|nr:HlyD family secretion protein [Pseudomonadota bacterium]
MSILQLISNVGGICRRLVFFLIKTSLILLGPAAVFVVGGYIYATGGRIVTTDNAYIKADKILISAEVSGPLSEVHVGENVLVAAGDTLIRIEDEPYLISVSRAKAAVAGVSRDIRAAKAQYREEIAGKEVALKQIAYLKGELERHQSLLEKGVVSAVSVEHARHEVEIAEKSLRQSDERISQALARLGGAPDLPVERHPNYLEAWAEKERAEYELDRTTILAPTSGTVTNIGLQVGEYVTAGHPLFGIVASGQAWVDANLKETKLTHVKVGQFATIEVDAYPNIVWRALVTSIGAATGSEFSILPAQNATGNWVKVVQRVPVRLMFLDSIEEPALRAGMSVIVSIDTEHKREVPDFIARALARLEKGNLIP